MFEFTFSEALLIEASRRRCHGRKLGCYAKTGLRILLGSCLVILIGVCVLAKTFLGAVVLTMFFALLVFTRRIEEWLIRRRFRKSPYRDERIRIELSPDGLSARGEISNAQLTWAAFTAARRLVDGFLLYQGPGVCNWLPFNALSQGTVEEVEDLIRRNVSGYRSEKADA